MQRIVTFLGAVILICWGVLSFKKGSFHWRGSPRDENTERQDPVIFWFSALLTFSLAAIALATALGIHFSWLHIKGER